MGEALARGSRITGTQRAELAARLGQRYAAGESIRAIAEDAGRSFGFVHGLVKEAGVDLRGRGGATRGPGARGAAPAVKPARKRAVAAPAPLDGSGPTGTPPTEGVKAEDGTGAKGKARDGKGGKAKDGRGKGGKGKGKDGTSKDKKGGGKR